MSELGDMWEARVSARAKERMRVAAAAESGAPAQPQLPPRSQWPVPEGIRQGASGRDAFLWYICDGWSKILGGDIETVMDHDFGLHVLRNGTWQVELRNLESFPDPEWDA